MKEGEEMKEGELFIVGPLEDGFVTDRAISNAKGAILRFQLDESPPEWAQRITFAHENKEIGVLSFKDGAIHFEGNADESAKLFFDAVVNIINQYIDAELLRHLPKNLPYDEYRGSERLGLEDIEQE